MLITYVCLHFFCELFVLLWFVYSNIILNKRTRAGLLHTVILDFLLSVGYALIGYSSHYYTQSLECDNWQPGHRTTCQVGRFFFAHLQQDSEAGGKPQFWLAPEEHWRTAYGTSLWVKEDAEKASPKLRMRTHHRLGLAYVHTRSSNLRLQTGAPLRPLYSL